MDYPDTWSFSCIFFAHPGISHFRDWQFSIALGNLMVSRWPYMYLPWLHVLRWARNTGVFNLRLCGNWTNTNLLKWWATMCSWNTNCEILWCVLYYVVSGLTAIGCTCSAAENGNMKIMKLICKDQMSFQLWTILSEHIGILHWIFELGTKSS